jgi:hypothetical protein
MPGVLFNDLIRIEIEAFPPTPNEVGALACYGDQFSQMEFVHERKVQRRKGSRAATRVILGERQIGWMTMDE